MLQTNVNLCPEWGTSISAELCLSSHFTPVYYKFGRSTLPSGCTLLTRFNTFTLNTPSENVPSSGNLDQCSGCWRLRTYPAAECRVGYQWAHYSALAELRDSPLCSYLELSVTIWNTRSMKLLIGNFRLTSLAGVNNLCGQ